jgi:DNA-binding CsgD family transcriptional regulator
MNALTDREKEVILHIANGQQTAFIADKMYLSEHTLKNHKSNICKKLGFKHTSELYKYVILNATKLQNGGGKLLGIIPIFC